MMYLMSRNILTPICLVSVYVSALQTVNLSLIFVFKIHLQINLRISFSTLEMNIKETG